jgi:uncharacterized protein YjbI with pentapeptide repeats
MWSNLNHCDLSYCIIAKTILVESNLSQANFTGVDMSTAFLKYAKRDNNLKNVSV